MTEKDKLYPDLTQNDGIPDPTHRIKVSKLPQKTTEDGLKYFFENKKMFGGCDVETVDYDPTTNTAVVIFKETDDVERILGKMPILFEDTSINIERHYFEEEAEDVEYNECTIEVTGMSQKTTQQNIQMYFESKKGANADVLVRYKEEDEMYLVKFESETVVDAVINKRHILDGSELQVRRHIPFQAESTYQNQVVISGLDIKTTHDSLRNFLQARSKTDVNKIMYGEIDGTAIIVFKTQPDIEKLKEECKLRQLDGCYLRVDTVPVSKCIIVSNIKEGTSKDAVLFYFDNKKKSGVEGVSNVDLNTKDRTCIVHFLDTEAPTEACKKGHTIEGHQVKVDIYYECIGSKAGPQSGQREQKSKTVKFGSISVKVIKGQLALQKVDVIVNSTSRDLQLGGGMLSKSLLMAAGPTLQTECNQQYPKGIKEGEVAKTSGGKLSCKHVFHGCLPSWQYEQSSIKILETFVLECLKIVTRNNHRSIAFPSLGTGKLGYPVDQVARHMFSCVERFSTSMPNSSIKEVLFVVYEQDRNSIQAFEDEFKRRLGYPERSEEGFTKETGHKERGRPRSARQTMSQGRPYEFNLNNILLKVYQGDITSARVDVIVNSSNTECDLSEGGVSQAILKKGGREVMNDINKQKDVMKKVGLVVTTGGKQMPCEKIIHLDMQNNSRDLKTKILNVLMKTDELQKHTLAMPALGTTNANVLVERIASDLIKVIYNYQPQYIQEVHIIIYQSSMLKSFIDSIEKCMDNIREKSTGLQKIDSIFEPPKHWDLMDDKENYSVSILKSASQEYIDVMQKFHKSLGSTRPIVQIHRIQNKTLYQQYVAKKSLIDSTNPKGHQNEKTLWHGFAVDAMESINRFGFNRGYCGKNATAYGDGVYFARDASYSASNTYSVPDANGNKRIYMCKVLTGEYTVGGYGMRIPPQKSPTETYILYDCVVDNTSNPNMYIIFHDTQAYPEYMILFK